MDSLDVKRVNNSFINEDGLLKDSAIDVLALSKIQSTLDEVRSITTEAKGFPDGVAYISPLTLELAVNKFKMWKEKKEPQTKSQRAYFYVGLLRSLGILRLVPSTERKNKGTYIKDEKSVRCEVIHPLYDIIFCPVFLRAIDDAPDVAGHWSLLVIYNGAGSRFKMRERVKRGCSQFIIHYDSLSPHNLDYMNNIIEMFSSIGIVPHGQGKWVEAFEKQNWQKESWECGYVVIHCIEFIMKRYRRRCLISKFSYTSPVAGEDIPKLKLQQWKENRESALNDFYHVDNMSFWEEKLNYYSMRMKAMMFADRFPEELREFNCYVFKNRPPSIQTKNKGKDGLLDKGKDPVSINDFESQQQKEEEEEMEDLAYF